MNILERSLLLRTLDLAHGMTVDEIVATLQLGAPVDGKPYSWEMNWPAPYDGWSEQLEMTSSADAITLLHRIEAPRGGPVARGWTPEVHDAFTAWKAQLRTRYAASPTVVGAVSTYEADGLPTVIASRARREVRKEWHILHTTIVIQKVVPPPRPAPPKPAPGMSPDAIVTRLVARRLLELPPASSFANVCDVLQLEGDGASMGGASRAWKMEWSEGWYEKVVVRDVGDGVLTITHDLVAPEGGSIAAGWNVPTRKGLAAWRRHLETTFGVPGLGDEKRMSFSAPGRPKVTVSCSKIWKPWHILTTELVLERTEGLGR